MYGTVGATVDPTYSLTQAGQPVSSGVIAGMGSLTALGTFNRSAPDTTPADFHLEREYELGGHPAMLGRRAPERRPPIPIHRSSSSGISPPTG
jgi:hypothetical protein